MTPLLTSTSGLLCVFGFALVLFGITWVFGRNWGTRTVDGFSVVERRVPWYVGGPSIAAAWTWAVALMVSVQLAYQDGIAGAFWFTVPNIFAVLVYIWLGPQIREKLPEGHSLPEWIHDRFGHRGVTLIYLLVFGFYQIMAVTVQLYAGGNLLSAATGLPVVYLIPLLLIVTLSYTLVSGMEASVVTDCFQLIVMLVVGWLIVGLCLFATGGNLNFFGVSGNGGANPFVASVALTTGVISSIGLISGSVSDQQFWQRCFSLKRSDIRKAFLFGGILFGTIPLSLALLGFTAAAPQMTFQFPAGVDPSLVGFLAVQTLLPKVLAVLFLFMFLAGLCSTLDSGLNASSSLYRLVATWKNLSEPGPTFSLNNARLAMLSSGILGLLLAYGCVFIPGFSLKYLWFFLNTMGAAIVIPTVLSLFWSRLTPKGILVGSGLALILGVPLVAYGSVSSNDPLLAATYLGIVLTSGTACWLTRADNTRMEATHKGAHLRQAVMVEGCFSSAKMKFKRILFCAPLILAYTARADTPPIRIGGLMVLTGQYAMQGTAFREGIELAVAEINDTGGIGGKKLEFMPEDTGNLPVNALTGARKLLQVDGLVAAITTSYPELATGAAEFQRKKIPVLHLWDASPDIEAMGDYLFGIGPWTPSAGEVSAKFAISNLKAKTVVTFRINDPWSELVTGYFERSFTSQGGSVLQSHSFNPQEHDFRTVFSKVRALRPDVIYSPVGDNIVPFYVQLRQQMPNIPIISSDVIAEEHIRQAPAVFEGIYQSQMKDPSGLEFGRVALAYQKRFKKEMTLPWFVCTGYDSVKLLSFCAKKVGTIPAAVRDCIAETTNLSGVTQTFSFNPGGSSPQTESIFRLHKGTFVHEQLL